MDGIYRIFTDDTAAGDAGRQRPRDSLLLTAPLRLDGDAAPREVRIRNLSAGGLMAEIDRQVEIGTRVTLTLRGIGEVAGRVAWSAEGRIGVALDQPIDPKAARKPVGCGTQTPFYAKPVPR